MTYFAVDAAVRNSTMLSEIIHSSAWSVLQRYARGQGLYSAGSHQPMDRTSSTDGIDVKWKTYTVLDATKEGNDGSRHEKGVEVTTMG